jgi:hypothetical protein
VQAILLCILFIVHAARPGIPPVAAHDTLRRGDSTQTPRQERPKERRVQAMVPWREGIGPTVDLPLSDGTVCSLSPVELDSLLRRHPLLAAPARLNLLVPPYCGPRFNVHFVWVISPLVPRGPLRLSPFERMTLAARRYRDVLDNPSSRAYLLPGIDILQTVSWWLSVLR